MLKEIIKKDFKEAFKKQKKAKLSVLKMLRADLEKKQQEKRYKISQEKKDISEEDILKESELTEEEILDTIVTKIKKSKESIEGFKKGDRKDLIEKEKKEIEILEEYLPEQMTEEEVKKIVNEEISRLQAKEMKDMGRVMESVMPKIKGRAEGSLVSKIVREILS